MMSDAVRSIDASPNCPAGIGVGVPNGLVSGAVLIAASKTTFAVGADHTVPVHSRTWICGVPCPWKT